MNKKFLFIILIGLMFLLVSCVPGPNPYVKTADENGKVAGFWSGLWHGIISPITFFISLFTDDVSVYDVHNNGNWYDFGFVLGAGIILGGSGSSSSRRD
ncbi:hypothetical protein GYA37_00235 [candidate division WWE3 bacterium]|uniref:Uncharacterized protein n=1 Tax=candidate division WWE3 bacterium TaxID=2053526 RepID=A0A7X9E6A5_UNCKA|nr:hypothetical protein [candidate division WWE3 bacterium]